MFYIIRNKINMFIYVVIYKYIYITRPLYIIDYLP